MSTTKQKQPKVQAKIRKARDLEAHITTQFVAGVEFVEIRDYVPSTRTYGRGATFEKRLLPQIAEALSDLNERMSPSSPAAQIEGQQSLDLGNV